MFVVITKYTADMTEVEKKRFEHIEYLKKLEAEKKLIIGGKLTPQEGGLLVFSVKCKDELSKILAQDPYAISGLANFEILEFAPGIYTKDLKNYV